MENIDFQGFIKTLTDWVMSVAKSVNDLPGGTAFAFGLLTWFLVEQVLRRMSSWLRWLVLFGVVAGLGYTLPYLFGELFDQVEMPNIPGLNLNSDSVTSVEPELDLNS